MTLIPTERFAEFSRTRGARDKHKRKTHTRPEISGWKKLETGSRSLASIGRGFNSLTNSARMLQTITRRANVIAPKSSRLQDIRHGATALNTALSAATKGKNLLKSGKNIDRTSKVIYEVFRY